MVIFFNLEFNQRLPPVNKQKFVECLRHPSSLDSQSLKELESIIDEYPYFQNARTIIAKGSKQLNTKNARALIGTAAVYATDRALLKRYINDQLIFLNPLEVHESHEAERERDLTDSIKTSRVANAQVKKASEEQKAPPKKQVIKRPKPEETVKAPTSNTTIPTSSVPSDLDHIIEELYQDLEELKVNRAKLNQIENDLAEQEAVDQAVQKATKQAPEEESKSPTDTPQDEKTVEVSDDSTDLEATQKSAERTEEEASTQETTSSTDQKETEKSEEEKNTQDKEPIKTSGMPNEAEKEKILKASQSRSARSVKLAKEEDEPKTSSKKTKKGSKDKEEKEAKPKKTTAKKTDTKSKSSTAKTSSKAKSATNKKTTAKKTGTKKSTSSSKKKEDDASESKSKKDKGETTGIKKGKGVDQESIIANFIKTNPSISPADASKIKTSSEDLSDPSTELHPDIASEYLAEIYIEQGSYDRAIQIYEALIVRFPEKSVYFADIIKKINEER